MKKTIYIHIGTPKTGTTSIQKFCYLNRDILEEKHDLFYPITKEKNNRAECNRIETNGNFFKRESFYPKFIELIKSTKCSRILISEEMIFLNEPLQFIENDIFNEYSIKIIVYVRNSVEFLTSLWSESSGNLSYPTSFESFVEKIKYSEKLKNLIKIADKIGAENVILKSYEKKQLKNGDVVSDFLDIFDIETNNDFKSVEKQNLSIDRKYCDIVQFMIQSRYILNKENVGKLLALCKSGDERKVVETLTDDTIKNICDTYAPIEKELSKKFNNNKPIFIDTYPRCYGKKRNPYESISKEDIVKMKKSGLEKIKIPLFKILKLKTRPWRYKIKECFSCN